MINLPVRSVRRSGGWIVPLLALLLLVSLPDTASAECINYPDYLHRVGAVEVWSPRFLAAHDGYAYVTSESQGLTVLDLSDPEHPVEAHVVDLPVGLGVDVSGSYAYVAAWSYGLYVVDISDPGTAHVVGQAGGQLLTRVQVVGDYAYCASHEFGMVVYDISYPTNPTRASSTYLLEIINVTARGNYAYVCAHDGFHIFDVSDPEEPLAFGFLPTSDAVYSAVIDPPYAYVSGDVVDLYVIDISDPYAPVVLEELDVPGYLGVTLTRFSDLLYMANSRGLIVFDVSTPGFPEVIGAASANGQAEGVAVHGNHAYLSGYLSGNGVQIVDISNPASPPIVGASDEVEWSGSLSGIDVDGPYAYLAANADGLRVADVSEPGNPVFIGALPLAGTSYDVRSVDGYAYLANGGYGIRIIDVDTPSSPVLVTTVDTPGGAARVEIVGSRAYVADEGGGLQIISIANPNLPWIMGGVATPGSAQDVKVEGDYAYVADGYSGLTVIDVSDPFDPTIASGIDPGDHAYGVDVSGAYAYLSSDELTVIDVSDPTDPQIVGSVGLVSSGFAVRVVGSIVYAGAYDKGTQIIDVSDPTSPVPLGSVDREGSPFDLTTDGSYLYVANGWGGFYLIDFQCDPLSSAPEDHQASFLTLLPPAPNPMRDQTAVRFHLPAPTEVRVLLYDASGRQLRELLNRGTLEGSHQVIWDGRDCAGRRAAEGVYFVRVLAGGEVLSRRLILLR